MGLKIYTKTGDKGETSLFGGKRVSKASIRVDTYGTVDELNSAIGAAVAHLKKSERVIKKELENIQNDLLDIGSALADPSYSSSESRAKSREESRSPSVKLRINPSTGLGTNSSRQDGYQTVTRQARTIKYLTERTEELEKFIDSLTAKLPELRNFILPGGGEAGSLLHLARTICRRAERRIVELQSKEQVSKEIVMYFNRLSDLLFTMARFVNHEEKKKETLWSPFAKATGDKKKKFDH